MVVVCGTVGEDEHSVGLREIINIKHGGIEKWGVSSLPGHLRPGGKAGGRGGGAERAERHSEPPPSSPTITSTTRI